MLRFKGSANLHRIVVLNPKGGSGKTTLAFSLAGYIASSGRRVALIDMDRQGSSTRWLQNRSPQLPRIDGIAANIADTNTAGDLCIDVPEDIDYAVVDAPAGLASHELIEYTCGAHAILVPVLSSDFDIHAASRLISDLLLVAQVSRRNKRLGVIANRIDERTVAYQQLVRFLNRLSIAVVGTLRDTQNYVWAASGGLSIHEMQPSRVSKDLEQWEAVTKWLERRLATPLTGRDMLRPAEAAAPNPQRRLRKTKLVPIAAALVLSVMSIGWWMTPQDVDNAKQPESNVTAEMPPTKPVPPLEAVLPAETLMVNPRDEFRQKWQLSGIAKVGGNSVLILSDREDMETRHVNSMDDLDGWTVKDTGSNYAVFTQQGEEVRLVLNEEVLR